MTWKECIPIGMASDTRLKLPETMWCKVSRLPSVMRIVTAIATVIAMTRRDASYYVDSGKNFCSVSLDGGRVSHEVATIDTSVKQNIKTTGITSIPSVKGMPKA